MKCVICRNGRPTAGKATVTFDRGESTFVIKGVPANVCGNCGEYYLTGEVARNTEKMFEEACARGVIVEVRPSAI